jgi:hypothetical protein
MQVLTGLNATVRTSSVVLLAIAFSNAALAKPKKLKTPSSEMGIQHDLNGAPSIRLDHRAKHIAKPSRKRPAGQ